MVKRKYIYIFLRIIIFFLRKKMVLQLYSRKDVLCHVESKWTTCTCSCAKFMRKMFKTFKYVATANGKGRGISFYKFEFPSPKDDWAKFVWNPLGQWFWRRFLAAHDVFSYSATVFLWEMVWPFNLKKLKLFLTKMLCVQVSLNCSRRVFKSC